MLKSLRRLPGSGDGNPRSQLTLLWGGGGNTYRNSVEPHGGTVNYKLSRNLSASHSASENTFTSPEAKKSYIAAWRKFGRFVGFFSLIFVPHHSPKSPGITISFLHTTCLSQGGGCWVCFFFNLESHSHKPTGGSTPLRGVTGDGISTRLLLFL